MQGCRSVGVPNHGLSSGFDQCPNDAIVTEITGLMQCGRATRISRVDIRPICGVCRRENVVDHLETALMTRSMQCIRPAETPDRGRQRLTSKELIGKTADQPIRTLLIVTNHLFDAGNLWTGIYRGFPTEEEDQRLRMTFVTHQWRNRCHKRVESCSDKTYRWR